RPRPTRYGTAWWVEHDGAVALVRRPSSGLLGGLLGLPGADWGTDRRAAEPPFAAAWRPCPVPVRHGFTHFALELRLVTARPAQRPALLGGEEPLWVPADSLGTAGLPTLYRKAVATIARWQGARLHPGQEAA
ncbi:MAG: NUDIX domain-containing protein, partial [Thermaurantiacus sp.]